MNNIRVLLPFATNQVKCAKHKHFIKNLIPFVFRPKNDKFRVNLLEHGGHARQTTARHSAPTHQSIHCFRLSLACLLTLSLSLHCIVRFRRAMTAKDINEKSCPMNFGGAFTMLGAFFTSFGSVGMELIGNFCLHRTRQLPCRSTTNNATSCTWQNARCKQHLIAV